MSELFLLLCVLIIRKNDCLRKMLGQICETFHLVWRDDLKGFMPC
jgi:hypothetical protein